MSVTFLEQSLRFADPWALGFGVVALVAFAVAALRERRPSGGVLFPSLALIPGFRPSWRARLRWVLLPLRLVAVLLLAVALARPEVAQAKAVEGIDIVLAIDISSSMQTRDMGGQSRMDATKRAAIEFIRGIKDDRIGVVLFSAEAIQLSPLTLDHEALRRLVEPLEAGSMLSGGTAIGDGLATGVNLLRDSPARSKVAVLLTDGESNTGKLQPVDAAHLARVLGVRVYTIGASGASGATGELDERSLRQVAETAGGAYHRATESEGLLKIYRDIAALEKTRIGTHGFTDYDPRYAPLLIAGGALLLLELLLAVTVFRRLP